MVLASHNPYQKQRLWKEISEELVDNRRIIFCEKYAYKMIECMNRRFI